MLNSFSKVQRALSKANCYQFSFKQELAETARKICTPGKGILAADESEGTLGKKFVPINVKNTFENRRRYRQTLFSTPKLEKYISGVIMFSESVTQKNDQGKMFVDVLKSKGIVPGIKVDKGLQTIPGTGGETSTMGLDSLAAMAKEYYDLGCRFAKWRAVLNIDLKKNQPTQLAMQENAWGLARYAAICQENGLVPIVEPEILVDGTHSIKDSQRITEEVLSTCFRALQEQGIFFEGCLLKPNMVTPGSSHPSRPTISPEEIATRTVTALSRTVVPALVGVVFLSGGQSEEEASLNLNAMNALEGIRKPWTLTFSYGRALQNSCVNTWAGKDSNIKAAQEALMTRARANGEAELGSYKGSDDASAKQSLHVDNYKY